MAFPGTIKRFISILLLIVLIQKMGGGLYFHNYFHAASNIELTDKAQVKFSHVNYSCNCIDDFYLPFTEPVAEPVLFVPISHQSFNSTYVQPHCVFAEVFNSLRAPPAPSAL